MSGVLAHFRAIFFAAICAGVIVGGALAMLHHAVLVPMIAQAEVFEDAAASAASPASPAPSASAGPAGHTHQAADAHGPSGTSRVVLTVLADMLAGIGFALLLAAGLALRGGALSLGMGAAWGMAGFAVFSLAPALGLPPELPGTEAADLFGRQIWWLATIVATGIGLALLAFGYRLALALAGVILIVAPHVVGAPRPLVHASAVPAELARNFVIGAMGINLVFWVMLGVACVFFLRRLTAGDMGAMEYP